MDEHLWFYYLAGVPLLGIMAQWLAWQMRLPSILLLLAFGVALGRFIDPDRLLVAMAHADESFAARVLFPIVSLCVAVILFEGGLSLRLHELKEAGGVVLRLVSIGAVVSWGLTAVAACWLLDLDPGVAALLGAILIVTGPTVVGPLLRHIRPTRRVGSILKWEGIVIDPIGAVLAVLVFENVFARPGASYWSALIPLGMTLLIGGGIGGATAWLLVQMVKRFWLPDFLHGVGFLAVALGVFALSNVLQHESGLVTVTVLGVLLANQKSVSIRHVMEFKEQLQVFLISCLFIVLGSRLDPQDLRALGWQGLAFLAVLILLVRPLSVLISTLGSPLTMRERCFLSFVAPRGIVAAAVSSVFALTLGAMASQQEALSGLVAQADKLAPLTFLVIVGTVAIYGLLAAPLARRLQLADPRPQGILFAGAEPWIRDLAAALQQEGQVVMLVDTNFGNVAAARMRGLTAHCYSVLSEYVREEMDLFGIGRLLALTPNDQVNTLAVREFAHIFGRQNVYQLSTGSGGDGGTSNRRSMSELLTGRILFGAGLHHDLLAARVTGGTVKKTQLSEEFTFDDFRGLYGDSAIVLFIIAADGNLSIRSDAEHAAPVPGDTLIAVVPSQD